MILNYYDSWFNNPTGFAKKEKHPFHLVDPSPWPLYVSINALSIAVSFILYFGNFEAGFISIVFSIGSLLNTMYSWFFDIVTESTFEGQHTLAVQLGLRYGMLLFIVSEIMFFVSFFWAFFHSSLAPSIAIGCVWPPLGIQVLDPFGVPLLNTAILLSSGVTITWAHRAIVWGDRDQTTQGLALTILLGIIFTGFQGLEYTTSEFSINDGIYGSVFYMATGFHGFHVLVGTIFIFFCLIRHYKYHFTVEQHFGFEAAAWYWHFVDVVWLFLFATIYWWGC